MSNSCTTWRYGYGKPKAKYTKERAKAAKVHLEEQFGMPYHVYKCPVCGSYHVGSKRPGKPVDYYAILGHMVAAALRGKTTPPIKILVHRESKMLKKEEMTLHSETTKVS